MRYFTADLHLGHVNIIRYCNRPFRDVEEMNAALLANWRDRVSTEDEVWVLGDLAMGRIRETLPLAAALPGRKHLVPGNHDRCWPGQRRIVDADLAMYADAGFEVHDPIVDLKLDGVSTRVCHFPVAGDSQADDRFRDYRPELAADAWLLHGHVHEKWRISGRQINVGVDVWNFRPVAETEVIALIRARWN